MRDGLKKNLFRIDICISSSKIKLFLLVFIISFLVLVDVGYSPDEFTDDAFEYVDMIRLDVSYSSIPHLEVNLSLPDTITVTNIIQNTTFVVNATVYCRERQCENVMGTVRYNLTSQNPDTPVNTTIDDKPFYIQESPSLATKSCPTNPLDIDEYCNLTWIINATGNINSNWKVDVLFNSSDSNAQENNTNGAILSITDCSIDIDAKWSYIKFGLLNPYTGPAEAPGNSDNEYNITVNGGSCNSDLYVKGTDLVNQTLNSFIGIGNVTWSNVTNSYSNSFAMSTSNQVLMLNILPNKNVTTWYWINVPSVYAGYYNGTITITGVKNGETP